MTTERRQEWRRRRDEIPEWLGIACLDPIVAAAVQAFCGGACDYDQMIQTLVQALIENRKQNIKHILRLTQLQPGPTFVIDSPTSPKFCPECGRPL